LLEAGAGVRAHLPAGCFPRGEKRQADIDAGAVELGCGGGGAGEYGVVGGVNSNKVLEPS